MLYCGQEPVADLAEDERQDDEAEHRRQRAGVAGAEPADLAADGVADGALLDVEGEGAGPVAGRRWSPATLVSGVLVGHVVAPSDALVGGGGGQADVAAAAGR